MIEENIEKIKNGREIVRRHVDVKLRKRLKIFFVIVAVMFVFVARHVWLGDVSFVLTVVGFIAGTGIGWLAGRMFRMYWHPETKKVVSQLDVIGGIILVLYISVEVGKKWVFGHWFEGSELNAFSLVFLMGLLLGRLLSMVNSIRMVLVEEKKM